MPIDNTDLNNTLIIAKDAFVDIPEGWKDSKPSFIFIPNDGSGAQKREFTHRPVEVFIQKDLPKDLAHHYIETFIYALPHPLCPMIASIQITECTKGSPEWTLDVILSTPTEYRGLWTILPKIEKEIPPETLEAMQKFILKLAQAASPLKSEVTEEECAMTLVYRDAPIMAGWYRPNFNIAK